MYSLLEEVLCSLFFASVVCNVPDFYLILSVCAGEEAGIVYLIHVRAASDGNVCFLYWFKGEFHHFSKIAFNRVDVNGVIQGSLV